MDPISPDETTASSHGGRSRAELAGRRVLTFALMMAMAVAALEQTVVSTALPSIIADLRGVDIFAWVSSAYLLAFTVSTPIYGKLADRWGRKRLLLFGLGLFLVGSALSGTATSMGALIAMRVVQGLGFGAIMPIVLTIIGDIFTLDERARVQGWFSGVWGAAGVIGPIVGGVLTDHVSWRWVFFVTLPFGISAASLVAVFFHEKIEHRSNGRLDWPGALLLSAGTSALLLSLLGEARWPPPMRVGLLVAAAAGIVLFVLWERRAADPVLPLDLFASRTFLASVLGSLLIGWILFAIEVYLPLYVQGVMGESAIDSGTCLTPLLVSWSLSVVVAAKAVIRVGFRRSGLVGSTLIAIGCLTLALGPLLPDASRAWFMGGLVFVGLGMGPTSLSYILAVQESVPWHRRGAATGAISYFRTTGGCVGVAVLGAILASRMGASLGANVEVAAALRPESHAQLSSSDLTRVREAFRISLRDVYFAVVAAAGVGMACAANLPRGTLRGHSRKEASPEVT